MNRLAALTVLCLTMSLTACESFTLIGNVSLGAAPTLGENAPESDNPQSFQQPPDGAECLQYQPMPTVMKQYAAAHRKDDPAIEAWVGWLYRVREYLGEC